MSKAENHKPPERGAGDIAHTLARAGIASVPVIGGAAVELFQLVITPPLEKRREEWMREIGEALGDLEKNQGVRLEDLRANDAFVDTVLQASQIALRNSQEEKRQALKNAILHAALPNPPEQSLQQMFLSYIDVFTVWHLRLLSLFHDPQQWATKNNHKFTQSMGGSLSDILSSAFPELGSNRPLYDQIWNDLYSRSLVSTNGLHTMMTAQGLMARRTTDLGTKFLQFTMSP